MQTIQFNLPDELKNDISFIKSELENLKENYSPKEPEDFLTRIETAKLLKISLVTVHEWSKPEKGILRPLKFGNRTYYSRKEIVKQLLNSNK